VPDPKDVTKTNNYKEQPTQLAIDWPGARLFYPGEQLTSGGERPNQSDPVEWEGKIYRLKSGLCWKTTTRTSDGTTPGMFRLQMAKRLVGGRGHLNYKRFLDDLIGGIGSGVLQMLFTSFKQMMKSLSAVF
jgi:adenine-specific DNA-methyltransferase